MAHVALALLPVLVFLATLVLLDSFKLVRPRSVVQAIAAGALAALAAGLLHGWLLDVTGLSVGSFSRYGAPLSEELLKAAYVIFLIQRRRVGFLVDAAIQGFAVGAGFALVENAEYLRAVAGASALLWFVRGLGTALLHGATTSILAMLAKSLGDRSPERRALAFLPGLAAAVGIHSLFNHALVSPVLASLLLLVAIPAAVIVIFERSETATREWLGAGLDLDLDLLKLILSGAFPHTRLGAYLESLKAGFQGPVVADMFCLLRVELELSIRAKGMLLAREAGFEVPVDADLKANLAELKYLEKSIGRTGLLALKPLHVTSGRDLWHHYLLEQGGGAGNAKLR